MHVTEGSMFAQPSEAPRGGLYSNQGLVELGAYQVKGSSTLSRFRRISWLSADFAVGQCCRAEVTDVPSSEILTKSVGDLSGVRPRQTFQVMYRVNAVPRELAGER